ncbi:MAG: hypothetical protein U9R72_10815 [Chloroflexota bacterium]|nr:hypothetical protein [Chloroflexota bacterium]
MTGREPSAVPRSGSTAPSSRVQPAPAARARRCSAARADGRPCRAWAVRGTDPPLCAAHGGTDARIGAPPGNTNAVKHGHYRRPSTVSRTAMPTAEHGSSRPVTDAPPPLPKGPSRSHARPTHVAAPGAIEGCLPPVTSRIEGRLIDTVIASLWNKQVMLSRYIDAHMHELSVAQLIPLLRVEGQNASRLGRLLRDRRALLGDTHDRLNGAIAQALEELSAELGVDLVGREGEHTFVPDKKGAGKTNPMITGVARPPESRTAPLPLPPGGEEGG